MGKTRSHYGQVFKNNSTFRVSRIGTQIIGMEGMLAFHWTSAMTRNLRREIRDEMVCLHVQAHVELDRPQGGILSQ